MFMRYAIEQRRPHTFLPLKASNWGAGMMLHSARIVRAVLNVSFSPTCISATSQFSMQIKRYCGIVSAARHIIQIHATLRALFCLAKYLPSCMQLYRTPALSLMTTRSRLPLSARSCSPYGIGSMCRRDSQPLVSKMLGCFSNPFISSPSHQCTNVCVNLYLRCQRRGLTPRWGSMLRLDFEAGAENTPWDLRGGPFGFLPPSYLDIYV